MHYLNTFISYIKLGIFSLNTLYKLRFTEVIYLMENDQISKTISNLEIKDYIKTNNVEETDYPYNKDDTEEKEKEIIRSNIRNINKDYSNNDNNNEIEKDYNRNNNNSNSSSYDDEGEPINNNRNSNYFYNGMNADINTDNGNQFNLSFIYSSCNSSIDSKREEDKNDTRRISDECVKFLRMEESEIYKSNKRLGEATALEKKISSLSHDFNNVDLNKEISITANNINHINNYYYSNDNDGINNNITQIKLRNSFPYASSINNNIISNINTNVNTNNINTNNNQITNNFNNKNLYNNAIYDFKTNNARHTSVSHCNNNNKIPFMNLNINASSFNNNTNKKYNQIDYFDNNYRNGNNNNFANTDKNNFSNNRLNVNSINTLNNNFDNNLTYNMNNVAKNRENNSNLLNNISPIFAHNIANNKLGNSNKSNNSLFSPINRNNDINNANNVYYYNNNNRNNNNNNNNSSNFSISNLNIPKTINSSNQIANKMSNKLNSDNSMIYLKQRQSNVLGYNSTASTLSTNFKSFNSNSIGLLSNNSVNNYNCNTNNNINLNTVSPMNINTSLGQSNSSNNNLYNNGYTGTNNLILNTFNNNNSYSLENNNYVNKCTVNSHFSDMSIRDKKMRSNNNMINMINACDSSNNCNSNNNNFNNNDYFRQQSQYNCDVQPNFSMIDDNIEIIEKAKSSENFDENYIDANNDNDYVMMRNNNAYRNNLSRPVYSSDNSMNNISYNNLNNSNKDNINYSNFSNNRTTNKVNTSLISKRKNTNTTSSSNNNNSNLNTNTNNTSNISNNYKINFSQQNDNLESILQKSSQDFISFIKTRYGAKAVITQLSSLIKSSQAKNNTNTNINNININININNMNNYTTTIIRNIYHKISSNLFSIITCKYAGEVIELLIPLLDTKLIDFILSDSFKENFQALCCGKYSNVVIQNLINCISDQNREKEEIVIKDYLMTCLNGLAQNQYANFVLNTFLQKAKFHNKIDMLNYVEKNVFDFTVKSMYGHFFVKNYFTYVDVKLSSLRLEIDEEMRKSNTNTNNNINTTNTNFHLNALIAKYNDLKRRKQYFHNLILNNLKFLSTHKLAHFLVIDIIEIWGVEYCRDIVTNYVKNIESFTKVIYGYAIAKRIFLKFHYLKSFIKQFSYEILNSYKDFDSALEFNLSRNIIKAAISCCSSKSIVDFSSELKNKTIITPKNRDISGKAKLENYNNEVKLGNMLYMCEESYNALVNYFTCLRQNSKHREKRIEEVFKVDLKY